MSTLTNPIPKVAITSTASGLLLMAFFTMMWTTVGTSRFQGFAHWAVFMFFSAFCGGFIVYSITLFKLSKHFGVILDDSQQAESKKLSMWYGIIFGAEGITIPIVASLLLHFGLDQFVIPAIAMIVGLHFYPMATIFKRTIDYYLATFLCIVAIIAGIMIVNGVSQEIVLGFTGIGGACTTTCYGLYMVYKGNMMLRKSGVAVSR